jgi:hypothetical protein
MSGGYERFESLAPGDGNPRWNQSFYYNFYDPVTKTAGLIRLGLMENLRETNTWFVFFQDGLPIYNRVNMNLPYTFDRPANGVKVAGMFIHAVEPLKKTRILFSDVDFSVDLCWDERNPMANPLTMDSGKDVFSSEMAHVHLEGTSNVSGHIIHRGRRIEISGTGFRDIGVGPRNWDALKNYRLAWPIFEDGTALAGVRAISTGDDTSYMRMYHDGKKWLRVTQIEGKQTYAEDTFSIASAHWTWTDETGKYHEMTGKPLLRWFFSVDTFLVCEQIMEYRTSDGRVGYGLHENGYRLPWKGIEI